MKNKKKEPAINYEALTVEQIKRINEMISAPGSKLDFKEAARIVLEGDKVQEEFRKKKEERAK